MKRVQSILTLLAFTAVPFASADEILRLNFDEAPVDVVPIPYLGGPTDIIPEGVSIGLDDPTNGQPQQCSETQGPDCEEPWVDVSAPEVISPGASAGIQGGNVLFLDQEDLLNPQGEGLFVSGLPALADAWTVEIVFRTFDPLTAPAEYNIQNIIGTENAAEQTVKFQLRIFGDGLNSLGVPASGQIQSGDLTGGSAFDGADLEAEVWYHAAMTYDNGTMTGYLDGVAFGSSSVDTGYVLDMLAIGYYMSGNDTEGQSIRGLYGDIDAVSVSDEALSGGSFRLLGTNVNDYSIY